MQAHRFSLLPSLLVPLGIAAALVVAPTAYAQSDADVEKLYKEGVALMKQGKDTEAEVKLQQCWDLKRTVDTATNLGELELDLGQDVEAATHLDYAEKHAPNSLSPALKKRIGDLAGKARARVAALTIKTTPADALIAVDGKDVGRSLEGPTFVKPGPHEVTATLAGYEKATAAVSPGAGEALPVALTLKTATGAPPIAPPPPPPPGGDTTPPPHEENEGAPVGAWVLFGAGATVAVVGGVLLGVGLGGQSGTTDDANAVADEGGRCEPASAGFEAQCDDVLSSQSSNNTLTGVGAAALGVGAASAAVGLVWVLTSGGKRSDAALQLHPVALPSSAGFLATGRF